MPQLLDPDDHRFGFLPAGPTIIDRQRCPESLWRCDRAGDDAERSDGEERRMTTPFDDPQAELAWMFLQCLQDGDVDECFALLSDDFTYSNVATRESADKAALKRQIERRRHDVELTLDLLRCIGDGDSVVIEAQGDGVTASGTRYESPYCFIVDTLDGQIVSLREYSYTRLVSEA
jgi:ketosteroid isomerase-like protein